MQAQCPLSACSLTESPAAHWVACRQPFLTCLFDCQLARKGGRLLDSVTPSIRATSSWHHKQRNDGEHTGINKAAANHAKGQMRTFASSASTCISSARSSAWRALSSTFAQQTEFASICLTQQIAAAPCGLSSWYIVMALYSYGTMWVERLVLPAVLAVSWATSRMSRSIVRSSSNASSASDPLAPVRTPASFLRASTSAVGSSA